MTNQNKNSLEQDSTITARGSATASHSATTGATVSNSKHKPTQTYNNRRLFYIVINDACLEGNQRERDAERIANTNKTVALTHGQIISHVYPQRT